MKTLHPPISASESEKKQTTGQIQPLPTWLTVLIIVILALLVLGAAVIWL